MSTYRYTDAYYGMLKVEPSKGEAATTFIEARNGAHIPAADLPKLVVELYRAAGQEPPIIPPRLNWGGTDRKLFSYNGVFVERVGKSIRILDRSWSVETARGVARVLAELADAADAEPDPEKLAALIDVIGQAGVLGEARGEIARAVLAAGYTRSES